MSQPGTYSFQLLMQQLNLAVLSHTVHTLLLMKFDFSDLNIGTSLFFQLLLVQVEVGFSLQ